MHILKKKRQILRKKSYLRCIVGHVVYGQRASVACNRIINILYSLQALVGPQKMKSRAGFGPRALSLTPLVYSVKKRICQYDVACDWSA